jgi:hypothetical protein
MNYILISDCLWYSGYILTSLSILFTYDNRYLSISLVFFGQFITIISRPISRIKKNSQSNISNEINYNEGKNNEIIM